MKALIVLLIIVLWILEGLLGWWLFGTDFVLIGVVVAAISAAFAQYMQLFNSLQEGPLLFAANLILTPLLGMLCGFLVVNTFAHAMLTDMSHGITVALVLAIVAGFYGCWIAPLIAWVLLGIYSTSVITLTAWALAFLSYTCIGFAWGMLATAIHLHLFR